MHLFFDKWLESGDEMMVKLQFYGIFGYSVHVISDESVYQQLAVALL